MNFRRIIWPFILLVSLLSLVYFLFDPWSTTGKELDKIIPIKIISAVYLFEIKMDMGTQTMVSLYCLSERVRTVNVAMDDVF